MKQATFESIKEKCEKFKTLLDAEKIDFGHHDSTNGFFIEVTGAKHSAQGTNNGETGHFIHFFKTTKMMHIYLNDKIQLFGGR